MRILIENGGYHLENMGDVAMLQITAQRIRSAFPDTELLTLSHAPKRLAHFIGGSLLDPRQRQLWLDSRALPIPVRKAWLPKSVSQKMDAAEHRFQVGFPRVAATSIKLLGGRDPIANCQTSQFVDDIKSCDLIVASGGGFLTDSFLNTANDVLTTLELAQNLGKPTLVFGQGIGPLTCPDTLRHASRVLPKVSHIGLREQLTGRPILNSCGVSDDSIACTGDDAVELAYARRPSELGDSLGINLRLSNYSCVTQSQKELIQRELIQFVESRSIASVIAPISYFGTEVDGERVREVMRGTKGFDDLIPHPSPEAVIEVIGRCRAVVTGSYHAGVFALSQGVSVVALVASKYYQQKFQGLRDQFGSGCHVIDISTANSAEQLRAAMNDAYEKAPLHRERLLESAANQVSASRSFYERALNSVA